MKETDEMRMRLYKASGIAAMIPGLQYAIDALQGTIDALRGELAELQGTAPPPEQRRPRLSTGWSSDPEERKREMQRRMEVRQAKQGKRLTPVSPEHPGHAKWLANVKKARRRYWDRLSPRQRKQHIEKMNAGRTTQAARKPQHVNGKEATE